MRNKKRRGILRSAGNPFLKIWLYILCFETVIFCRRFIPSSSFLCRVLQSGKYQEKKNLHSRLRKISKIKRYILSTNFSSCIFHIESNIFHYLFFLKFKIVGKWKINVNFYSLCDFRL